MQIPIKVAQFSKPINIDRFPQALVSEVHLAGHTVDPALGDELLIDSHDTPVAPEVWRLYQRFIDCAGTRPTLIERDGNVPDFEELMLERSRAVAALECVALEARA